MSEKIKLDDHNFRIHNDKNKSLIRKSLEECGAGRSILLDKDDVVIAGNGVYEQAQELGLKVRVIESDGSELIAIKRKDLSTDDEKRKLLAIADNKTTDTSEFDIDLLTSDVDVDVLQDLGFELDELKIKNVDFPEEFTAPKRENPPVIKISFPGLQVMEKFERELKPLCEKFEGVSYIVSCGEL